MGYRDYPFNLKKGENVYGQILKKKHFLSLTWTEKNILKAFYALTKFQLRHQAKKIYYD